MDGAGTVTVTPAVSYQGETRDYSVVFKAPGPMYGSVITVQIPAALLPTATAPDTVGSLLTASLRVHQTGGVDFGDTPWTVTDDGLVTINIDSMNLNDTVRVSHRNVTVGTPDATGQFFLVQTNTTGTAASVANADAVTDMNGAVYRLAGSGTLEVTSTTTGTAAVPVGTTHDLQVKYTAAAKFSGVYIRVALASFTDGDECRFNNADNGST